jgi:uncharacterized protein YpuA (DUF1002 family)
LASKTSRRASDPSLFYRAFALIVVALILVGFVAHQSMAASNGKTITLGESLNDAQRKELLAYFGAKSNDKVETVTVADTRKDMNGIVDASFDTAYSSTALTCRPLGDGLDVTTHNITLITPSMYAMALVTAGIGDATLVVASPNDAPSSGQAALSGVFKTWKIAPCDSGDTNDARQRLALEELALTAELGQSLSNMTAAGAIVLNSQKTVVINHLKKASDIDKAIRAEESAAGVAMPDDLRAKLVDLLVRLANQKIDWSTFSAGWVITQPDPSQITMVGDGIAIRNAQLTATARAANNMTATAKAAGNMTKTAQANQTATAKADADKSAAMTATAGAIPTKTPVPPTATVAATATATPPPTAVSGTITGSGGGSISINPGGGAPEATYQIDASATITRGGAGSTIAALKKGDAVNLTVDFNHVVTQIAATPAPAGGGLNPALALVVVVPVLGAIVAWLLLKPRGIGEAFVIKRVSAA